MNWIQSVVNSYADNEAPDKFFYWSALVAISATVRKNVYIDRFHYNLYPNIFAFLIAKSGCKKGIPISLAKNLVEKSGATRIIAGRNSMPRIIQDLGKVHTNESGVMIKDAQALLVSGELAAFLVKDPDALNILTELHNTHEYENFWTNSLKGTGVDKLKSPCLTLFGASNEDLLWNVIAEKDIKGGFVARTFIVMSNEAVKLNSLVDPPDVIPDHKLLSGYLKDLIPLKGEFKWGPGTKVMYNEWYHKIMKLNANDETGTINRIGDKVLKLSMIISLGESTAMVMEERHIFEAIAVSVDCYNSAKQVTMGSGKNTLSSQTRTVMRDLIAHPEHKITRKKFLADYWGDIDAFDLDRIATTLEGAGAIDIQYPGKGTCTYVLKQEALEKYTEFKKGIQ